MTQPTAIEQVELTPYALPFRRPYVSARGSLERRELILVRLHTGGDLTGLGEAAPLALRGGPALDQIAAELDGACRERLEGASLEPDGPALLIESCRDSGVSLQTLAGVDIALHDLWAKVRGEPLWRTLGAAGARPVPCNATLVAGPADEVARDAGTWAKRGFQTFKLKVGMGNDEATVAAVRTVVGPEARIRIDANGVWSVEEATDALRSLQGYRIEICEQPTDGLEGLAALRERLPEMRIAADESVVGSHDAELAVALEACDFATVKLAKAGGITEALSIARLLPTYLSSALDGPVGIAAAAHVALAIPDAGLAHGLATGELFAKSVASVEVPLRDAALLPADAPGLGVELDEGALERQRI